MRPGQTATLCVVWPEGTFSTEERAQTPTWCPEVWTAPPRPRLPTVGLEGATWFMLARRGTTSSSVSSLIWLSLTCGFLWVAQGSPQLQVVAGVQKQLVPRTERAFSEQGRGIKANRLCCSGCTDLPHSVPSPFPLLPLGNLCGISELQGTLFGNPWSGPVPF